MQGLHLSLSKWRVYGCTCENSGPKSASALVLLHGFGSSLQTWDDWARNLEADHRVIRYDLPGFGLTGADPAADYSDRRGIAVLLALLDRLVPRHRGFDWLVLHFQDG